MIRTIIAVVALFLSSIAAAAACEGDAPPGATQCGVYIDAATSPIIVPVTSGVCRYVLPSTLAAGDHTCAMDARGLDPLWGPITSPKSAPFTFTKTPSTVAPPSNLRLAK